MGLRGGRDAVSDLREMAKNRLVTLPGHFAHPVRVDSVEEIGAGFFLLKVRDSSGHLDETQVTGEELESALAAQGPVGRWPMPGICSAGSKVTASSSRSRMTRCSRC